jgi:hypothetical protein
MAFTTETDITFIYEGATTMNYVAKWIGLLGSQCIEEEARA